MPVMAIKLLDVVDFGVAVEIDHAYGRDE